MADALLSFDPFAALGLDRHATLSTIRERYYKLARRYHPNRNNGVACVQDSLAGYFQRIHQAWTILSNESHRRRYLEALDLAELEDGLEAQLDEMKETGEENSEDVDSSDADDYDILRLGRTKPVQRPVGERLFDGQVDGTTMGVKVNGERGRNTSRRKRSPAIERVKSHESGEGSDSEAAAERRKLLQKSKRRELETFEEYKYWMTVKHEAETQADKHRERFEQARWFREQVEKRPREASEQFMLASHIQKAAHNFRVKVKQKINARMLQQTQGRKRPRGPTINTVNFFPEDGLLGVGSPTSPRGHRRGWSSDISGDQTSSEDEGDRRPSPRRRFRSPMPFPTSSRAPEPEASLGASSRAQEHQNNRTISHHHHHPHSHISLPSLLVKRPTGFDGRNDVFDPESSAESPSSRSPSPMPDHSCQALVLFNATLYTSTEQARSRHNRTASAPNLSFQRPRHIRTPSPSPQRDHNMFEVKQVGDVRFPSQIPIDHVHKLNFSEENRLLGVPPEVDNEPKKLLDRLNELDPAVAQRFMVKPDIKVEFAFRLISDNSEHVMQKHQSFIALSYRRRLHVEKHTGHFTLHGYSPGFYTLPLDPNMLQAVWDERATDDEGLWVDQICIDQDSEYEKVISMSAMDLVYRSARLVVVVLDDIKLMQHEGKILESHMEDYERLKHVTPKHRFRRYQPPYLESNEGLQSVLRKILASAWFRRAWCRHEMRLAKEHVFLLPCRMPGSYKDNVLRLTSSCIAHLLALATEIPFDAKIEFLKPALHAFFRDRTTQPEGTDLRSHHGNFTTVVAEVFAMEAGGDPKLPASQQEADARRDKVSIILNTMECGLALRPKLQDSTIPMSLDDCYYSLLLLALAARDPGALCSVGKPMDLSVLTGTSQRSIPSWLFEPTNVDAGLNNYKTLRRLSENAVMTTGVARGAHYLQVDLKFLKHGLLKMVEVGSESYQYAKNLIERCHARNLGRHSKRYLINDSKANEYFGSMREVYIQTLGCVFECGPEWMTEVCQTHGVSRWRQDLEPACFLLVSLRNMYGKWPEAEWVDRAAGFMMDFVNFLVIRGMPQRQLRHPEPWRPVWVSTPNHGKVVTFRPVGKEVRPAVPTALLDTDYDHLARLWMLEPGANGDKWTLLGKSVLFSDDLAMQQINFEGEAVRRQQRVFGRRSA